MENENEILEQPEVDLSVQSAVANIEDNSSNKNLENDKADGSKSKFKSEIELEKAYKNLEAEFTRKSQKLKELEKIMDSFNQNNELKTEKEEQIEAFLKEDWPDRVAEFVQKNKNAKDYALEISNEILSDKQLALSESPLEDAWAKVASKKFTSPSELASNEDFLNNFVLNNNQLKEKIIDDYFKEKQKNYLPKFISGIGSSFAVSKKTSPKNFDDAKEEVLKLFN